ncbi:MAG TPA: GIY-YIG nuclease family protein [Polyangiaceae bacterium]
MTDRALTPEDVMQRLSCTRRRPDPTDMSTPIVYFIGFGSEFVKIGKSTRKNLPWRLKMLQVSSPLQLELVCVEDDSSCGERTYHELFTAYRAHGEWFRADGAVLQTMRRIHESMSLWDWANCMELSE